MRMGKVPSSEQTNHPFYSLNEKKKRSYETFQVATPLKHFILPGDCFDFFHRVFILFYFFSLSLHRGADDDEKCVCVLALGFVIGRVCYIVERSLVANPLEWQSAHSSRENYLGVWGG